MRHTGDVTKNLVAVSAPPLLIKSIADKDQRYNQITVSPVKRLIKEKMNVSVALVKAILEILKKCKTLEEAKESIRNLLK